VRPLVDDDRERHEHLFGADEERERVFVDVEIARVDRDAARAQLRRGELADADFGLENVGALDGTAVCTNVVPRMRRTFCSR
jgi:hypothetical protein